MALQFSPPRITHTVKLELDQDVAMALDRAISEHNSKHGDGSMKLADAVSELVNDAVRKANGRGRRKA